MGVGVGVAVGVGVGVFDSERLTGAPSPGSLLGESPVS